MEQHVIFVSCIPKSLFLVSSNLVSVLVVENLYWYWYHVFHSQSAWLVESCDIGALRYVYMSIPVYTCAHDDAKSFRVTVIRRINESVRFHPFLLSNKDLHEAFFNSCMTLRTSLTLFSSTFSLFCLRGWPAKSSHPSQTLFRWYTDDRRCISANADRLTLHRKGPPRGIPTPQTFGFLSHIARLHRPSHSFQSPSQTKLCESPFQLHRTQSEFQSRQNPLQRYLQTQDFAASLRELPALRCVLPVNV